MISGEDFLAALDHNGKVSDALGLMELSATDGHAWAAYFDALGLDAKVALALAASMADDTSPAACYASGLVLGITAGRRDAAECMAVPSC